MFKQRKSQLEAILIVLFLLALIFISPKQDISSITGKYDYGYCGDQICNIDEDRWNCPTDCAPTTTPTMPTPGPAYTPTPERFICELTEEYCLEVPIVPQKVDLEKCECTPFANCKDISNYEVCASNQHCPSGLIYPYKVNDAPYGCCLAGKCEAGKLCSLFSSSEGSCRTKIAYIGGSCLKDGKDGICMLTANNDGCYCNPAITGCVEGSEFCINLENRKYCKGKKWVIESCSPGTCLYGKCIPPSRLRPGVSTTAPTTTPEETAPTTPEEEKITSAIKEQLFIWSSEKKANVCKNIDIIPARCRGQIPNKKFKEGRTEWTCDDRCNPIKSTLAPYSEVEGKKVCENKRSVQYQCRGKEIGSECEYRKLIDVYKGKCSEACKCEKIISQEKPAFEYVKYNAKKGWVCDIYNKDPCYNRVIGERCNNIFSAVIHRKECNANCECVVVAAPKSARPRPQRT